jgi:hypothetical protein
MLSAFTWVGQSGGYWDVPSNWSGGPSGAVPGANDTAQVGSATVHCRTAVAVASLQATGTLAIDSGGSFSPSSDSTIGGLQIQSGATLSVNHRYLTITNGFTNAGNMVLLNSGSIYVQTGSVTNAAGATITCNGTSTPNDPGSLFAALNNLGTINVPAGGALAINPGWSGTPWSTWFDSTRTLTNTGTIQVGTGALFSFAGQFDPTQGTIKGSGMLMTDGAATMHLGSNWTPAVSLGIGGGSTIEGSGKLDIAKGNFFVSLGGTIDTALENQGTVEVGGDTKTSDFTPVPSAINGTLTLDTGSTLVVGCDWQITGTFPLFGSAMPTNWQFTDGALTIANGFTNNGTLELAGVSSGSTLTVTSGTLTNATGGTISSTVDSQSTAKPTNAIDAVVDNLGKVNITSCNMTISSSTGSTASLTNAAAGTINIGDFDLTVSNGLTNDGTASLAGSNSQPAFLIASGGTLLNASGATINLGSSTASPEPDQDYSVLTGQVVNQGTINASAGKQDISPLKDGTVNAAWKFTNTGTVNLAKSGSLEVAEPFDPSQGTISGTGGLILWGATVSLANNWTPAVEVAIGESSTVAGPGKLIIASGKSFDLCGATVNTAIQNQGTLFAVGATSTASSTPVASAINGTLTTAAGSTLIIGCDWQILGGSVFYPFFSSSFSASSSSVADDTALTIANGFTNNGTLELAGVSSGSTLTLTSGTLTNATGGTISSTVDSQSTVKPTNAIVAIIDNLHAINVAGAALKINTGTSNSALSLTNEAGATIDVAAGNSLTLGGPSVNDLGAIKIEGNGVLDFASAWVTINGQGYLQGTSAGTLHVRGALMGNTTNVTQYTPPGTVLLDGLGTAAYPQLFEVLEKDQGNVAAGFSSNLVYAKLQLGAGTCVKLMDSAHNSAGSGAEAVYAATLAVPASATLNCNGLHVYASNPVSSAAAQLVDNSQSGFWSTASGTWTAGPGLDGGSLVSSTANGSEKSQAAWSFTVAPGAYDIAIDYTAAANLTTKMPLDLYDGGTWISQAVVNERVNPNDFTDQGVGWKWLGTFKLTTSALRISTWNSATDGAISVDAIQLRPVSVVGIGNAGFTCGGSWATSAQGAYGGSRTSSSAVGGKSSWATWSFAVTPGTYDVNVTWVAGSNLSAAVPMDLWDGTKWLREVSVNQRVTPSSAANQGISWQDLGSVTITGTQLRVTTWNSPTDGQVCADAVQLLPVLKVATVIDMGGTGSWSNAGWTTLAKGYLGNCQVSNTANGSTQSQASWTFSAQPGTYEIEVTWQAASNLSKAVPLDIYDGSTWKSQATVNEQNAPSGPTDQGVTWQSLGLLTISNSTLRISTWNKPSDGGVCIDAVRLVKVGE